MDEIERKRAFDQLLDEIDRIRGAGRVIGGGGQAPRNLVPKNGG